MSGTTTIAASGPDLLRAVGLGELNDLAALPIRIDRKYLLPVAEAQLVGACVPTDTRVLEIDGRRAFRYATTYFDTPGLVSFLDSAHRRRRRFKVRTRVYEDSGLCFLEVKTRRGRQTVKDRMSYDPADRHTLTAEAVAFVEEVLGAARVPHIEVRALEPVLDTRFVRSTFLLADPPSRVTVDRRLVWSLAGQPVRRIELLDRAVVETKTGSRASSADRTLWSRGDRPVSFSKYATGYAALRPELPRNRWHRVLRRTSAPGPDRRSR